MAGSGKKFLVSEYQVEDSVGYLMARARAKLAKSLDAALIEYDVTPAQGGIVLMLATGKFSTAAELARELYVDSASITRMIDRLEKRGLIVRSPRGEDRRVLDLSLTTTGQSLAKRLPAVFVGVLNQSFAGFSGEEIANLKQLLRKLLAS